MTRPNKPTIRLGLTYLGIIMFLSISFSVIFYNTSTGGLETASFHTQGSQQKDKPGSMSSGESGTIALGNGSKAIFYIHIKRLFSAWTSHT